jgi:hypothetical protein
MGINMPGSSMTTKELIVMGFDLRPRVGCIRNVDCAMGAWQDGRGPQLLMERCLAARWSFVSRWSRYWVSVAEEQKHFDCAYNKAFN